MDIINVKDQSKELLFKARDSSAGRAAQKVAGGPKSTMTQTIIALKSGSRLGDHESPGEATLEVLQGTVRFGTAHKKVTVEVDHLLVIPDAVHYVEALEDAVILLTAVKTK